MRKDNLQVITKGTRHDSKQHLNVQGSVTAKVSKGFNDPSNSITVEVISGLKNIERREEALINIEFSDGTEWTGTFDKLYKIFQYHALRVSEDELGELVKSVPALNKEKTFPNGFANWYETHHIIVAAIEKTIDIEDSPAWKRFKRQGTGGMWELGEELTDLFEETYKGIEWGNGPDWSDTLDIFIHNQLSVL